MKIYKSPIKLLVKLFTIQVLLLIVFGLLKILDHYYEFYSSLSHLELISIDLLFILLSSLFLIAGFIFALQRWRNQYYLLKTNSISIFKNNEWLDFPLTQIKSLDYRQSFLGKVFKYGDIILELQGHRRSVILETIPNVQNIYYILKHNQSNSNLNVLEKLTDERLKTLLTQKENDQLEFKGSLRWDFKLNKVNKVLEKTIMKTIAGFLNNGGGVLLIGVSDNGQIIGLENDCKSLPRNDLDGFENHFNQVFAEYIGKQFRPMVKIKYPNVLSKNIAAIAVASSNSPVYLKSTDGEEFYLRTGNTTSVLSLTETIAYLGLHWKQNLN